MHSLTLQIRFSAMGLNVLRRCGMAGYKFGKSLGVTAGFINKSTVRSMLAVSKQMFVRILNPAYEQQLGSCTQPVFSNFKVLVSLLYTFSTAPINTNKLNKGINL